MERGPEIRREQVPSPKPGDTQDKHRYRRQRNKVEKEPAVPPDRAKAEPPEGTIVEEG